MNTFCRLYRFLSFFNIKLVNFIMSQIVSNDLLWLIDWNFKKRKNLLSKGILNFHPDFLKKRGTSSTMMTIPLEKISSMSKHICECRTMTGVVPGSKWPVSSLAISKLYVYISIDRGPYFLAKYGAPVSIFLSIDSSHWVWDKRQKGENITFPASTHVLNPLLNPIIIL